MHTYRTRAAQGRVAHEKDIRSSPLPDHIPLHSPLYGGVQREGLVTCRLFLRNADGNRLSFGLVTCHPFLRNADDAGARGVRPGAQGGRATKLYQ